MEIVLTGILFVLSEGCTWRAIDGPEARWNSIYQYYRRWCGTGLWERFWERVTPALHRSAVGRRGRASMSMRAM